MVVLIWRALIVEHCYSNTVKQAHSPLQLSAHFDAMKDFLGIKINS